MNDLAETHRSFVNTWECDENDHLNVQFYMKRFDEAARFHRLLADGEPIAALPAARHIRYHAELRAGDATVVRSGLVSDSANGSHVVHLLECPDTGRLHATAVDTHDGRSVLSGGLTEFPDAARPRSLADGPEKPDGRAAILAAGGLVSHRRIADPGDCDAGGGLLARHYIGAASDAAPHVWGHAGFASNWLIENGYGRVAVEMKATFLSPARAGDPIEMVSKSSFVGRTIRLHHEMFRIGADEPLARVDVVGLIVDLRTRRAITADQLQRLGREAAGGN
ncbi:MAG: thioesterase family protein [Rhizobiaceae bacterium]|nr:thioesterase family protein [Rhizobiaceae bacterium]MCV0405914.1 thioesterase family protein [Rhizobiaceae bacterium]